MATSILSATNLEFKNSASGPTNAKLTATSNTIDFEGDSGADITVTGISNLTASGTIEADTLTDGTLSLSAGNVTGVGDLTASGTITAGTLTDGTLSLSAGNVTGVGDLTASGTITAGTLTDGTLSLSAGNVTGVGDLTASGTVEAGTLTDGNASLNAGSMTGVVDLTASGTVTVGTLTDGTASLNAGSMSGVSSIGMTNASITYDSGTSNLTIASSVGNVFVDGVEFNGGAVSSVTDLTASGTVTAGTLTDGNASLSAGVLSGLVAPTQSSHAANKEYVDSIANGLSWKESVRLATTANVDIATSAVGGTDSIDGVLLQAGDRVLFKNQSSPVENGIYVIQAAGAALRTSDFAVSTDVSSFAVFVEEGTVNADEGFVCTNNSGNAVVGTDDLVFTQFTGLGSITAGDGMIKTGNVIDVVGAANGGITVNADSIEVDSTVVRTSGNQNINGIKTFNDVTQASAADAAGAIFKGGCGIAKDVRCDGEMYAVSFNATSDMNFKQDILDINESDLDKLLNVRAVSYRFKGISDESKTRYGILAQDLEEKGLGHMVSTDHRGIKKVNYNDLVGLLVGQVKDLKQEINELRSLF